ncbi:hypothetical protein NA56DRAFT_732200 [Hyaloscypha hepaticicola]|uniref:Tc1-like transposase DDE domain-containing protein n=1 Tax=Hyaloscypha hepaticicola TaxID=2082293 RepID=A0A2J6PP53_9HELO|nr:hypothetical protein NA56DRAFT_732200 [Hyaloscypha hepaticicola]
MEGDQNAKRRGITVKVYLEVLAEYLSIILEYNSIFIQDNTPIYKTNKVTEWFQEIGINIMA